MKKLKLLAIILAAALMTGLFAGCGSKAESTPSEQPSTVVSSEETPAEPAAGEEQPAEAPLENVTETSGNPENMSPTTGRTDTTTTYKPIMVQIDNSDAGRKWQTGLSQADVVYETANEIDDADTRLTALFNDVMYKPDAPEKWVVGSLRSTRYYHQWLASEWDAMFIHQGGPDKTNNPESDIWGESSKYIKQRITGAGKGTANANMIFKNDAGDSIDNFAMTDVIADSKIFNFEPKQRQPFKFYPAADYADAKEIKDIKLTFSPLAKPGWTEYKYDAATNKLTRYMHGSEIIDKATGEAIQVQNLIVQYVPYGDMPGDPPRAKTDLFGTGPAEFIINGKHLQGTWERDTVNDPTIYKLTTGEEVTLVPGNTWIAIHPNNMSIEITYADNTTYSSN